MDMDAELTALRARFLAYAERHLHAGEPTETSRTDDDAIRLKIDHSFQVLANAEYIMGSSGSTPGTADGSGPSPETVRLCRIAALFHDTGRFPQYAAYKTFRDAESANHASLGVRALLRERLLDSLSRRDRGVVLGAIALHNRRTIPNVLPAPLGAVARLVRDADKIDIFQLLLERLHEKGASGGVVVMHAKDDPERYSPAILESFRTRSLCDYRDVHWYHDVRMLLLSWVYDLNHAASVRLVAERGHFELLLDALPETPPFPGLVAAVREDIASILAGKDLAQRGAGSV